MFSPKQFQFMIGYNEKEGDFMKGCDMTGWNLLKAIFAGIMYAAPLATASGAAESAVERFPEKPKLKPMLEAGLPKGTFPY